tara:strand:- start:5896 stop:7680 length:1785 start_codon:yes stop_codon:yes gene_type:complete
MSLSTNKKPTIALKRLLDSIKYQNNLIISATTCSILNKLFDLAPPVLIGLSVDVVAREENSWIATLGFQSVPSQLGILAFTSFIIWSAESFFEYLYGLLWRNLAQSTQHKLRIQAYTHLQELEMSFFEKDRTGRLMSVLNDDINQLERFLDHGANQILQLIITVLIVGGTMTFLAPGVALLAFLPIPIILWGSIKFQSSLAPRYQEVRERAGDLASRLNNNLGGMVTIKSFATESWEVEKLSFDSKLYQISNRKAIKLSAAFIPLIRFAILFAFLAILIAGGMQTWKGHMAIGTYSFLVFITQRLLWPLTTLGHVLDDYQRSMASTHRVLDLIDTPIKILGGSRKLDSKDIKGEIIFKNVDFSYENRETLFRGLNLNIKAGSTIGIVGPTGSGKSTLIKLLLRLYSINNGEIKIDGNSIELYNLRDLRRCIALVSQEVYLFHGTIEENISYGSNNINRKDIVNAAEVAEAAEFINKLPKAYKTLIGERGQRLSGGQRQRIAIARAILKDAPIVILDEATASVDNETEAAIQRSLLKITSDRTTIVIAHRLSTVRNADEIIVLDKGSIAERGKHDYLIKASGLYKDLWKVQAGII